jgi:hypothetical protein
VPPPNPPCRSIDLLEERSLLTEVELEAGKIRLFAFEITLHGGDCFGRRRRGCAGFGAGCRRSRIRSAASALFVGSRRHVMPTLFQAIPQKPLAVSKIR